MKPGARIQAAIEVLGDILDRHRPAATALSDWGKAHRFAGSSDRAAIGNVVYDALRHKQSHAHHMGDNSARALTLAAASEALGLTAGAIADACDGTRHAPEPLSAKERAALLSTPSSDCPDFVAGDFPAWLLPELNGIFGLRLVEEGRALASRAPVDLRVNTIQASRDETQTRLEEFHPAATPWSPVGLRIPPPKGAARTPNVENEGIHGLGWFEVQDEGSQIAAAMANARPGNRVLDLCAGAGGKSLALAAAMSNTGEILAYDSDKPRLRPMYERIARAKATCITPMRAGDEAALEMLGATFDVVLVDAPCSGTGTWRRKPDAKWRLKPETLAQRHTSQHRVLETAARHVRPGGKLVYITCSVLPSENTDQIAKFLIAHPEFRILPWRTAWATALSSPPPARSADGRDDALLLTPAMHETDGFFIAVLERS